MTLSLDPAPRHTMRRTTPQRAPGGQAIPDRPPQDDASLEDLVEIVARQRDRAAFVRLFEHFAPRLRSYLMKHGLGSTRADEVVQEVMLRVWRKADRYDRRRAAASTWVFTIARNARIDVQRKQARPEPDPDDPAFVPSTATPPHRALRRTEDRERVQRALGDLPPEQAEAIRGAYFDPRPLSAVAEEQAIPLGTLKSRIRLALGKLRDAFLPAEHP